MRDGDATEPLRCGAKTRDGDPCKMPPLKGAKRCRMHGSASPQSRAKAERTLAQQQAEKAAHQLGVLVEVDPGQALLDEVHRCAGMVAYYGQRATEAAGRGSLVPGVDQGGFRLDMGEHQWLRLWNAERDRLTRTAAVCLKAGIEERRVQIAEATGMQVAQVIRAVLDRLQLSDEQRTLVGVVVPEELRALGSQPQ